MCTDIPFKINLNDMFLYSFYLHSELLHLSIYFHLLFYLQDIRMLIVVEIYLGLTVQFSFDNLIYDTCDSVHEKKYILSFTS